MHLPAWFERLGARLLPSTMLALRRLIWIGLVSMVGVSSRGEILGEGQVSDFSLIHSNPFLCAD